MPQAGDADATLQPLSAGALLADPGPDAIVLGPAVQNSVLGKSGLAARARSQARDASVEPSVAPQEIRRWLAGATGSKIKFDGEQLGFGFVRPEDPINYHFPKGVKLDRADILDTKAPPYVINRFHLAPDDLVDGAKPIVLNVRLRNEPGNREAAKADEAAVEKAILDLVDANPAQFGVSPLHGKPSARMQPVHTKLLPGMGDQADSFVAVFRRWEKGVEKDGQGQDVPYFLAVDNANMRFHVKVVNGKALVLSAQTEKNFDDEIDPAIMTPGFTDDELRQKAWDRLQSPDSMQAALGPGDTQVPPEPKLLGRTITFVEGAWRAINIYQGFDLDGNSAIVIVDIKAGNAWAFASRAFRDWTIPQRAVAGVHTIEHGSAPWREMVMGMGARGAATATLLRPAAEGQDAAGKASARGDTLKKDGEDHGPVGPLALAHAKILDDRGNVLTETDAHGAFVIPESAVSGLARGDDGRIWVNIHLDVIDENRKNPPMEVRFPIEPGQESQVLVNPNGDDEELVANVNNHVYPKMLIDWIKDVLGLDDPRLEEGPTGGVHSNGTTSPGNAFYTPIADAYFTNERAEVKQSAQGRQITITFENTGVPSVDIHENTHEKQHKNSQGRLTKEQAQSRAYRFVAHLLDPVVESGNNEALADIVSMFIRKSPMIGNDFILKVEPPMPNLKTFIRTGENTTAYNPEDPRQKRDPHLRGEWVMGPAWKTFSDPRIKQRYGENAEKYAARLWARTLLYALPGDGLSAHLHVALADMTKDGKLPNLDVLRSAWSAHQLPLPDIPAAN